MDLIIQLFAPMLTAFAIAFASTPLVIKIAHHVGAIDVPKDDRRVHSTPIPRLGGLAIFLAVALCFLFFIDYPLTKVLGILVGSFIIIFIGFIDDIAPISAKAKFIGEIAAACILIFSGIRIYGVTNVFNIGEMIIVDDFISVLISIIWVVGITNTLNLIDGLDGLSGGLGTISAFTLAYVAFINGRLEVAVIALIIAGACLGFLPYNFNPARIFMGDTGALFLGFILSAVSMEGTLKITTALTFFVPVLALGIPIFDTFFSIVRRTAQGKSPFEADRGHLHHRILDLGFSHKRTVLFLYFINSLFGLAVVFLSQSKWLEMATSVVFALALISIPITNSIKKRK